MNCLKYTYTRGQHAAHYSHHPDVGHDLETWDCVLPKFDSPRPDQVPADAERHSGWYDGHHGEQHVLFVRRAPMTGSCPRCDSLKLRVGA